MKKTILLLIAVALIAAGAWYAMNRDGAAVDVSTDAPSETDVLGPAAATEVKGTVTAIDLEQAMVDGPYIVTVRDSKGAERDILVPSMGILLCAAKDAIASPYDLKEGDRVEANGTLTAEGSIVPCESSSHYLRLIK